MRGRRGGHRRSKTGPGEFGLTYFQGGGRYRQGGGRRGRTFDHGDLRFLILQLIA